MDNTPRLMKVIAAANQNEAKSARKMANMRIKPENLPCGSCTVLIRMMLRLDLALQIFSRRSSESPVDEILGFDFLCSRIGRCEVLQNRQKSLRPDRQQ